MKHRHHLCYSLPTFITCLSSFCLSLHAVDLLDAPGPGYRKQAEQLLNAKGPTPVQLTPVVSGTVSGSAFELSYRQNIEVAWTRFVATMHPTEGGTEITGWFHLDVFSRIFFCTGQTFIVLWAISMVAVMIFCFIFGTASSPIGLVIAGVVLLALAAFLLVVLRSAARPQTDVILSFLERELECRKL
jgi:hypothetical protein